MPQALSPEGGEGWGERNNVGVGVGGSGRVREGVGGRVAQWGLQVVGEGGQGLNGVVGGGGKGGYLSGLEWGWEAGELVGGWVNLGKGWGWWLGLGVGGCD
ncbi:MAG: hypothetical protein JST68_23200, partial [Bacteroidetes bacterium]|nr:hypothetical protein [Bacteroidota bacterium]